MYQRAGGGGKKWIINKRGCSFIRKVRVLALDDKYGNFFLIRLDQICPKWIKLDQIWISHLSKNVTIKSCHNYHENKHGQLFWIRSDQICPKRIKMDQIWIFHLSKHVTIKSCHIYHENKHGQLIWIRSDLICPKWLKLDQLWISHQSKNLTIYHENTHCYFTRLNLKKMEPL